MKLFVNKKDCYGCGACEQICPKGCIEMHSDHEGFKYPVIDETKCIGCNACMSVCQIHTEGNRPQEPLQIFAIKNRNRQLQRNSSSGGFIYNVAEYIIKLGGVVVEARFDKDQQIVSHTIINSLDPNYKYRGSKYCQSELGEIYKSVLIRLKKRQKVLFIGTPCQVSGLKLFIRKDFDNLYTIDLICHGVGSPLIFRDYISLIENRYRSRINDVNMRYKLDGWMNSKTILSLDDGKEICNTLESELYIRLYFSNYINRPSCYYCKYASSSRCGDLTAGDYWGIKKYNLSFYDDNGCSLVMANTPKGQLLYDQLKESFIAEETDMASCVQPQLLAPQCAPNDRTDYWSNYYNKGFRYILKKYLKYTRLSNIKKKIRNLIDWIRRV